MQENTMLKRYLSVKTSYNYYLKDSNPKSPSVQVQALLVNYFMAVTKSINLLKKYKISGN